MKTKDDIKKSKDKAYSFVNRKIDAYSYIDSLDLDDTYSFKDGFVHAMGKKGYVKKIGKAVQPIRYGASKVVGSDYSKNVDRKKSATKLAGAVGGIVSTKTGMDRKQAQHGAKMAAGILTPKVNSTKVTKRYDINKDRNLKQRWENFEKEKKKKKEILLLPRKN